MEAIEKSNKSGFDLLETMFDSGASNRKCACLLVDSCAIKKITFKLTSSLMFNNNIMIIIFCSDHIIKHTKNNLVSNGFFLLFIINYFQ